MKPGYTKIENGPKVGEVYRLKRDHVSHCGTFIKGAIVTIHEEGRRGYTVKDKYGNTMTDMGWDI